MSRYLSYYPPHIVTIFDVMDSRIRAPSTNVAALYPLSFRSTEEMTHSSPFRDSTIALIQDDVDSSRPALLVTPAEDISEDTVNRMLDLSSGFFSVAITPIQSEALGLKPMTRPSPGGVSLERTHLISVDAREGITTGISVSDRVKTLRLLGSRSPSSRTLISPGHIIPVLTKAGGTLVRQALPEASCDLVLSANKVPVAVNVELLDEEGNYPSPDWQRAFSERENIPLFTLSEITRFQLRERRIVHRAAEAKLPARLGGVFCAYIYRSDLHEGEHLVLVKGKVDPEKPVVTRVQAESTFSDVFGGPKGTRSVIQQALQTLEEFDSGVFVYLRTNTYGTLSEQIGRSVTIHPKPARMVREYGIGAQILSDLGVRKLALLSNKDSSLEGLNSFGLEIVETIPLSERAPERGSKLCTAKHVPTQKEAK